jgi:hypothetical protein
MNENTSVELSFTSRLNFPSVSVVVPFVVPFSRMFTPGKPDPFSSVIFPFT